MDKRCDVTEHMHALVYYLIDDSAISVRAASQTVNDRNFLTSRELKSGLEIYNWMCYGLN